VRDSVASRAQLAAHGGIDYRYPRGMAYLAERLKE
jgi:hypothetical protein